MLLQGKRAGSKHNIKVKLDTQFNNPSYIIRTNRKY